MDQLSTQFHEIKVSNDGSTATNSATAIGSNISIQFNSPVDGKFSGVEFNVQDSIQSFTGRDEVIRRLHNIIESNKLNSLPTVVSQTAAICGMGGVGKTETVRKYIQLYRGNYQNIIWINAESYSEAKSCLMHLALQMAVQTTFSDGNAVDDRYLAQIIYSHLKEKTLIVFDNVQQDENENSKNIHVLFPKTTRGVQWAIILTTRETNWSGHLGIDLNGLGPEECYDLLMSSLKIPKTCENQLAAREIRELCEGLPIVIQQVIANIREENELRKILAIPEYSLREYVTSFNSSLDDLIKTKPADSPVGESVFAIFQLTFQQMQKSENGKLALHCLDIVSLLSPEGIPLMLIKNLLDISNEKEFANCISLLIKQSLITLEKQLLRSHRMIQAIRKQDVTFLSHAEIKEDHLPDILGRHISVKNILALFMQVLNNILLNDNNIYNVLDNGMRLLENLKTLNLSETAIICEFAQILAEKLKAAGRYQESKTVYEQLLTLQVSSIVDSNDVSKHRAKFRTEICIAECLRLTGEYELAENSIEQTLHEHNSFINTFTEELNMAKYILADIYMYQGKYKMAETTYKIVLQEQKKVLTESHPNTLRTMHNLARVYALQCEYGKAEKMYKLVLTEREKPLGEHHPDTLLTMHRLAEVYSDGGNYDVAVNIYKEVLKEQEKILGENHPETLTTKHNLAETYRGQGKLDLAEEVFGKVLEEQEKVLGGSHPETLTTKHNLAQVYRGQGKFTSAVDMYKNVMKKEEKFLGESHPHTLTTKHNLAEVYQGQGKLNLAEEMYREVLQEKEKALGENHPETLTTKHNLAQVYQDQRNYNLAEEMYREVLQEQEKVLGKNHPYALTTKHNLAQVYRGQGKFKLVEEMCIEVLQVRDKVLGKSHPRTLTTKHNLAQVYQDQGKYNLAEDIYKEVLQEQENVLGKSHPDTLTTKHNLAAVYYSQGKYDAAEKMFQQVLQARKDGLGEHHPHITTTQAWLDLLCTKKKPNLTPK